ncbi:MAG TPA: (2Fe-2S)-binding protein [Gemmataceae bacterium]|nr:(2Fe-2S)-binding protein [Gemmataceae bacterium]
MSGDLVTIALEVNGQTYVMEVDPARTLAEVLREDLRLTGTHLACEHGVCGACTVAVDGVAARSCLQLAVQVDGSRVITVEGLAPEGEFHPIQEAMWNAHGFQCAFCAPGFIMTLYCLLESGEQPDGKRLREELSGNLCRCTGYASILAGAEAAVAATRPGADA